MRLEDDLCYLGGGFDQIYANAPIKIEIDRFAMEVKR